MNSRIHRFLPCSVLFIILAILSGCIKEPANLAYPAEILKWDEQTRQEQRRKGQKLINEWKAAILNAKEEFTIEPGHYRFWEDLLESPITFEGAENMEVIADGATFWVEKTEGSIFQFVDCKNLKIHGLTVDYDPLPFTQGTITGISPQEKSLYMAIDPGFASPMEDHILAGSTIYKSRIFILDPEGNMRAGIRDDWVGGYEKIAGDTFRVIMKGGYNFDPSLEKYHPYQTGDKIIIPVRAGNLFRIRNCESVSFENCHIYAANGIAFIATNGKGGHVFDRVNIIPRPGTGRLLSAVADGIHCYNLERGPLVKDCRIENLGDDAVAIHGFFGIARKNESSSRLIEVINPFEYNYHKGMEIELYDFMDMKKYGNAVIEQVEEVEEPAINGLIETIREDSEKAGRRIRSFPNKKLYRITLDSPVYLPSNALVVTNEYICAGFEVVNNRIRNIISRGILTKSHQGMIRGNTVENVGQSGIGLLSEASYWLEGPFNQDICIEDNRLDRNCISINSRIHENANGSIAVEVQMHGDPGGKYFNQNILIRDNTIRRSGTSAISVKNTEGVEVYGNTLIHPMAERPYLNRNTYGIHLCWTSGNKVGGNKVLQPSRWMTKEVAYGPPE